MKKPKLMTKRELQAWANELWSKFLATTDKRERLILRRQTWLVHQAIVNRQWVRR